MITYVCNSDFGKQGNVAYRTYQVAKAAQAEGYDFEVIARGNAQKDLLCRIRSIFPLYRYINLACSGIRQYVWSGFPAGKIQDDLFDWAVPRKIKAGDITHFYAYSLPALKRSKELGNINILDNQLPPPMANFNVYDDPEYPARKAKEIAEYKEMLKYVDYIVTSATFAIDIHANEYGVPRENIFYLPFGVDTTKYVPKAKEDNGKVRFLYVGTVETRKGILYLLDAWNKLNVDNAELVICGRVNADIQHIVKDNPTVIFKGYVDPLEEYQNADIFVFPSLWDNSPKALEEAMACGLPLIVTTNSGPIFEDKTAGLIIPPKDVNALVDSMTLLYNDKNMREAMGKEGRRITENNNWHHYGQKMIAYYKHILQNRKI